MSDERVSTEIKVSTVVAVITDHLHKKEEGRIRCVCVCVCSLVHRLSNLFNIGNWGVWEYYGIKKIM